MTPNRIERAPESRSLLAVTALFCRLPTCPITTPKIGPIETGNPNGMGMDMGNMGMDMGNMGMDMGAGTTGMGEHVGGYKTHGY